GDDRVGGGAAPGRVARGVRHQLDAAAAAVVQVQLHGAGGDRVGGQVGGPAEERDRGAVGADDGVEGVAVRLDRGVAATGLVADQRLGLVDRVVEVDAVSREVAAELLFVGD